MRKKPARPIPSTRLNDQNTNRAANNGTGAARLVNNAALQFLEADARFRAAVREGIAQADRGDFIEEDEMDARFEQILNS